MKQYQTREFAKKASVTVRTLRYYDKVGLLSPSHHTRAGFRLYTDADLVHLQQILALKFLGLSLDEIKACLKHGPLRLQEALRLQRVLLEQKRKQLETVLETIVETEELLRTNACDREALSHVIQVMQTEQQTEWVKHYFTPEQLQTMQQLSQASYSEKARAALAARATWTEEDQKRVDQQYAYLASELTRLQSSGANPASLAAQAAAELFLALIESFTQGDPEVEAGLCTWWQNFEHLPKEGQPFQLPYGPAEAAFLHQAVIIYKERREE